MDRAERIRVLLGAPLGAAEIEVTDDSRLHAGHAGAAPCGQTHYSVLVVSPSFRTLSRVARSRMVHELLAPEFASGLHAVALTLKTPEEYRTASI